MGQSLKVKGDEFFILNDRRFAMSHSVLGYIGASFAQHPIFSPRPETERGPSLQLKVGENKYYANLGNVSGSNLIAVHLRPVKKLSLLSTYFKTPWMVGWAGLILLLTALMFIILPSQVAARAQSPSMAPRKKSADSNEPSLKGSKDKVSRKMRLQEHGGAKESGVPESISVDFEIGVESEVKEFEEDFESVPIFSGVKGENKSVESSEVALDKEEEEPNLSPFRSVLKEITNSAFKITELYQNSSLPEASYIVENTLAEVLKDLEGRFEKEKIELRL